jgi:dTDP-4-amino-4,6-dideoxygalactose transaminase
MGEAQKMRVAFSKMYVDEEIKTAALDVLESGRYVKGENVRCFEEDFAKFCNAEHAVAVSSGTAALLLSLKALNIGSGDEVIVPAHTFIASASPVKFLGAEIVYADIDPLTYTVDCEDVERKMSSRTKAVIPVHLYGHPSDLGPLMALAQDADIHLIEDACQAHGAEYRNQKVGPLGTLGCFSFFPSKNMTVLGDGGMVVTNDDALAQRIRMLRDHGRTKKYLHEILGLNFRLSELHAAIGRVQLEHLSDWIDVRRHLATLYTKQLSGLELTTPVEMDWAKHVYHLYVIQTERRDALAHHLNARGVETGIHYPIPLHHQPCVERDSVLPVTEKTVDRILSLPLYPQLSPDEARWICSCIIDFFERDS